MKVREGPQNSLPLLYSTTAVNAGATSNMAKFRVQGYARVVGSYHATNFGAAAGFPRIRQSADGVNWSLVYVVTQDAAQAGFQYPFDITIRLPYVSIEYQQAAGGASGAFYAWAEARPE